jgi:hypothetical protein
VRFIKNWGRHFIKENKERHSERIKKERACILFGERTKTIGERWGRVGLVIEHPVEVEAITMRVAARLFPPTICPPSNAYRPVCVCCLLVQLSL